MGTTTPTPALGATPLLSNHPLDTKDEPPEYDNKERCPGEGDPWPLRTDAPGRPAMTCDPTPAGRSACSSAADGSALSRVATPPKGSEILPFPAG